MTHDVFISHSSKDKPIADAICAHLEGAGVRCWIAPRDIAPGEDWPTAITRAISQSRIMVLVFSASSNSSEDVGRELILAANSKLVIIPFKIENIEPEPGKQYYLARTHWLDAINPLTQEQIRALIDCVKALIPVRETPPIVEFQPSAPSRVEQSISVSRPPKQQPAPKKKSTWVRFLWIPATLILLSLAGWFVFNLLAHPATVVPKATPTKAATQTRTSIPVFTAKVGVTGATLYSGPGENYPKINFTYNDLTIVSQAFECSWLKISYKTNSGIQRGWVNSNQVTFFVKCSDIPADASAGGTSTTPVTRLTPTLKCSLSDQITVNNQTIADAVLVLTGPEYFSFTIPAGVITVYVCPGSYDYTFIGACSVAGANTIYGKTFGGDKLNFTCQ